MGNSLSYHGVTPTMGWVGPAASILFGDSEIHASLLNLESPCFLVIVDGKIGLTQEGNIVSTDTSGALPLAALVPAYHPSSLGDSEFKKTHGVQYAYFGGSMANGISSEELVIALGKAGYFASFGAGGLVPARIEKAIDTIQAALPNGPYAFNLIHSPTEKALERGAVELFLKKKVRTIEASAFLDLTPYVVHYRVSGLRKGPNNEVIIENRVIAKVSRTEVATRFMLPAPDRILKGLLQEGLITQEQAELSKQVPMADDITVEADSGGHTDNRPLVNLLPSIVTLRNRIQEQQNYTTPVRIGAGGGVGTPEAVLAAFTMGASYVVTGSVNQACKESGTCDSVRKILTEVEMADVVMAPASDMFEMGVKLQVLKRGTLFPMRAQKLYDLYREYNSIDEIPEAERKKLEAQVFRKSLDQVWSETVEFFNQRDPEQIKNANQNPKKKMALIFRWYLGLSSHWANGGVQGREMDYQIWAGQAMGAFNEWTKGTVLESADSRGVARVAENLMRGAAYLYRLRTLEIFHIGFPSHFSRFIPK